MVLAAIVINQAAKPPGLPSQSRDDLSLGTSVSLTNNDNTGVISWLWEFVSRPVGSSAVISGSALPSASFVPDVRGSYLVRLTVDGSPSNPATDTRIAAVKTAFLGIRKPATSEQLQFDPVEGWSAAQQAMIDAIDADAALDLKRNGSNSPTADIDWGGRKITNLGGLQNEGALRLGEISNPSAVSDKGFLYAKDDSGDTELFYMDDGGAVVQITRDGQLDVVSLQGDALPAKTADGFLKRNAANTAWEEVPYGTGANTVCQGNDSRLSDSRPPTGSASGQLGGSYPGPDVRGIRETAGPTLLTIGSILDGQVLVREGSTLIGSSTAGGAGGKVKVRVDDAADGYLHEKLLTGSGLSFAIGNPGGNETLTIDAYGVAKVSSDDTTPAFLQSKISAGAHIVATKLNAGGNELLNLAVDVTNIDGYKTKISATDTLTGYLQSKLVAGNNIVLTQNSPGGNETLTVATPQVLKLDEQVSDPVQFADDGYLYTKDVSGGTELFYRDSYGNILQISRAGRLNLADGYISFRYDELSPAFTTGSETALPLAAVPVEGAAIHVFRNGALMRPVSVLGPSRQEYTLSGDQVQFQPTGSSGDWYSALYIDGYMLRGAGGTVKQNVAMANNQSTDSSSDVVVGSFPIAAGDYQSMAIKFLATAFVTSGSLTGYVRLYNVTDSVLVSSFTFTSVTTTKQISSALLLPSAEKMYEIRISVTGGAGPSDRVSCMWAGLQIG